MILESDLYYFWQEISSKTVGALQKHGIVTVAELMAFSYEKLAAIDGPGNKSLSEIVYFIKQLGK
ncbi:MULTISPECIES: DNA-directed RNA polymerase subunit alpha C-terminal domain-containing protein [Sphingobacterium]|jgi:DNA-directed RNA polymerase alpha subunit|uniref:DNA-directed RNA polymerase subunit alpha C-terminal domain-containing protein n=1 Tax=Sphingobacterium TaxID=28453 RepID=UPI000EF1054E|nr:MULTISPECIES: DNA-directed RNA polymerase subunit alpha C-terminal domain-containing protein [Sphingobacterium]QIH36716.1 hypothetical protein G6053_29400 [Sphingobacterium sp. DR205]HAE67308.1 hypothetical protein [Sphingobacterium sp.]HAF34725.1 hypothetical protein [Sphingobacterium sp.]